jgi:hypothetical protein
VTTAQADADIKAVGAQMKKDYSSADADLDASIDPLRDYITRASRPALMMWLIAVLCVLLIACANVMSQLRTENSRMSSHTAGL